MVIILKVLCSNPINYKFLFSFFSLKKERERFVGREGEEERSDEEGA